MESQTYPGEGLSLPQLLFALNAELKSMAHSSSLTMSQVLQLVEDVSTASIAIDKLRSSLSPVNLLPLDILLLIPTHFESLSDLFRATFVCRRWRQTFIQHAPFWSQLCLTRTTDRSLLAVLLERVKQSPLDITMLHFGMSIPQLTLLSPFTRQIRSLTLESACRSDIQNASVALSGRLPLLQTLYIEDPGYTHDYQFPFDPKMPLFSGAVNVQKLTLCVCRSSFLSQLAFPNLTTLNFLGGLDDNPVSLLLDFLEASPSLRKINIIISRHAGLSHEDVPLDRVLILPYVKYFFLVFPTNNRGWELATHLSCPSAEYSRFELRLASHDRTTYNIPEDTHPLPLQWSAIVHQYAMGMVDEVQLKFYTDHDLTCSITFLSSSNGSTLELSYKYITDDDGGWNATSGWKIASDIFSRASRIIRDHPQVGNVRRLYIKGGDFLVGDLKLAANDIGKLLMFLEPLERLCLFECDLRPYLDPFLDTPLFPDAIQPTSFPPIKEFTIISPAQSSRDEKAYAAAVVKLAKSQHARGVPFERVTLPPGALYWVGEELLLSVNTVE